MMPDQRGPRHGDERLLRALKVAVWDHESECDCSGCELLAELDPQFAERPRK